jgi:Putative serine esterase (DUF676)
MTDPVKSNIADVIFNRSSGFTVIRDGGWQISPPIVPVAGFEIDPLLTAVTSWQQALNTAGFPTLTYSQVQPSGALAPNLAQLSRIAAEILSNPTNHPTLAGKRLAFIGHSRGGILMRLLLRGGASPGLDAAFMSRVVAAVTLHSPHMGSGVASAAVSVDTQVARIQAAFSAMGMLAPGFLAWIRGQVMSAAYPEIQVGSATLTALALTEPTTPVPGPEWHTFGGTSTRFTRLRQQMFTPDSYVPIFVPFPIFHWIVVAGEIGVPADPISVPALPVPIITELKLALSALASLTPELAHGSGDILTTDAGARLPFALSHTSNPLNHAEALYDPTLQAQVVSILTRLRAAIRPIPPAGRVTVPDVLEMRSTAAMNAVKAAGLQPRLSGSPLVSAWVRTQTPTGGTSAVAGSDVNLSMRVGRIP